jgi:hypothetical protein
MYSIKHKCNVRQIFFFSIKHQYNVRSNRTLYWCLMLIKSNRTLYWCLMLIKSNRTLYWCLMLIKSNRTLYWCLMLIKKNCRTLHLCLILYIHPCCLFNKNYNKIMKQDKLGLLVASDHVNYCY